MPSPQQLHQAAERLHAHLARRHYHAGLLHGPDAGVRFNLRGWRFLKSAFDFIPWRDDYVFMQTQGYWVLANWKLYDASGEARFRDLALETTRAVLRLQKPGGCWAYPLPERRHLIATVEGDWAGLALVASYAHEPREEFLRGAIRWHDYLLSRIGFQDHTHGKAINYFDRPRGKVPNNAVLTAWFLLRLWKATNDARYREHVAALLEFIAAVQMENGELPYVIESPYERGREHYLCYQYNAFQFLELVRASRLAPESPATRVLPRLAAFLASGVTPEGASRADCFRETPEMDYHTAVLAAALGEAARFEIADTQALSEKCYSRVLAHQRADGSFGYSRGDYGMLHDGRSYPRPQAMTLFHLLCPRAGDGFEKSAAEA
jgi:hypothetical protein